MLDYNHRNDNSQINSQTVTEQINKNIDKWLVWERELQAIRKYLGASRLGVPCSRALQYEYMAAENNESYPLDGQTLRIFETGHVFEELAIRWLRFSGFRLDTRDENGQQFGFKAAHGKIAGHVDGIITGIPLTLTLKLPCPMLWEVKTMSGKNWRETVKKGLVLSKPVYAAQIALYQAYMEDTIPDISKNPCLFTAINKDTSEIYAELIPFDAELAQRMSDKAVNIIKATEAGETLPRGFSSKEVFDCKICPYQTKCWGD
ncbi:hypothetical protein [Rickettsia endosymbiont of Orchestes rusci]|uniref:hypothetical protein n=1 Tax=Rickettsia endosymbiont of Orchestes rusci TaxID=3066250 RepID=UPI00313DCB72